jgi:hypothetical protein
MKRFFFYVLLIVCFTVPSSALAIEGFPGSTWGGVWFQLPQHEDRNAIVSGWVEQGIAWKRWGNIRLDTYARIGYGWDSENNGWANSLDPGVGVSLNIYSFKAVSMRTGIEYVWEWRYRDHETKQKAIAYISWYSSWDLMKRP